MNPVTPSSAVGQDFPGVVVDDFDEIVVVPHVEAARVGAIHAERSDAAVDFVGAHVEAGAFGRFADDFGGQQNALAPYT